MRRSSNPALWHVAAVSALTALNLAICRQLFRVEYTDEFGSIEGSFIAISRYVTRHWGDFSWFPLWHCGMPFQDTYVPVLHLLVAIVALIGKISAARAYHLVTAVTYALGPTALYWMAARLGAHRGAAFLGALFYSLFSPSALLMTDVARDLGGFWSARRLQVLTVYGEGPHVTAMTILPLAILALQYAVARRTGRSLAPAALAIALVLLTNVPGTGALALAVYCWICAQPSGRRFIAWTVAGGAALFAYGLACYGLPPSALATIAANMGSMHPEYAGQVKYGSMLLVVATAVVATAGYALARTRLPIHLRFAALYFGLLAVVVLTADYGKIDLVPQPLRMQLEMEMAACLLLGPAAWAIYERTPRWIRPILWAACVAPIVVQFVNYRAEAQIDARPADLGSRSEYATAQWLDRHLHGRRVYAAGSTSFWMNAFSETPQMMGCCLQGQSLPLLIWVQHLINAGKEGTETEAARSWLQALGVDALVVNGPESSDRYKDIQNVARFEGLFPVLHRERGDTIYGVPRADPSLAHVVRAEELAPVRPERRVDYSEVLRYCDAIADLSRPRATFDWLSDTSATIRTRAQRSDVVSVQVAWFRGWKAFVRGRRVDVSADGLGLIAIRPECDGECEIALCWTGRPDGPLAAGISVLSFALIGVLVYRRKPRSRAAAV